jgi:CHASE2 domain-containing sensor protein
MTTTGKHSNKTTVTSSYSIKFQRNRESARLHAMTRSVVMSSLFHGRHVFRPAAWAMEWISVFVQGGLLLDMKISLIGDVAMILKSTTPTKQNVSESTNTKHDYKSSYS